MKVKISNETSLRLFADLMLESEIDIPEEISFVSEEIIIEASARHSLRILEKVPLEMGENVTIWIKLSFAHSKNECLYARIRFNGGALGTKIMHNVSSAPFGSLLPEQPWHSGYAEVCKIHLITIYIS
jgi:hypothetical protein